jgi:hypothetical protein
MGTALASGLVASYAMYKLVRGGWVVKFPREACVRQLTGEVTLELEIGELAIAASHRSPSWRRHRSRVARRVSSRAPRI